MKFLTIVGARPQIIKASIISSTINQFYKNKINEIIVHTGQHYDYEMSKIFFKEFKIKKPKFFLNISNLNHTAMVGKMIEQIGKIILKEKPDLIIIYGDTNSTLAGAICGAKHNIKVAHIESGLRSHNLRMPEEINRIVSDRVSNFLYCPTNIAKKNLLIEGFKKMVSKKFFNYGDVMLDIHKKYKKRLYIKLKDRDYYLLTVHREENCKKLILDNILDNIIELSKERKVIFPAHPRISNYVKNKIKNHNIELIKPVGYFDFGNLIHNSHSVITDSGGVQKESYFFKKNCFVLRTETEWPELLHSKNNLINPNNDNFYKIIKKYNHNINNKFNQSLYGNGNASLKILKSLHSLMNKRSI